MRFQKMMTSLLAAALLLCLTACAPASETGTSAPTTGTTAAAPTTTAPTTAPTKPEAPAFEEMVLVENEDMTVKITAIEQDAIWGTR